MTAAVAVLGVESSCDESAIAIYHTTRGILANQVFSQIPLHRQYGGVVPELAARDHLKRFPLLLQTALEESGLSLRQIGAIAYTAGPGLMGALMTGASYARALSYGLAVPAIAIHHMEGHLLSPLLGKEKPAYPFIALLVSGGHTQLIAVKAAGCYQILGQTLDDAVGEAFDKTAKLMGLPYPGGPELARLAQMGNPARYPLSRPMTNRAGLDFSFSGLKTQVRLLLERESHDLQTQADIAASFQQAVVDTLLIKCRRAWQMTGYRDLVVAGGVSANSALRNALLDYAKRSKKQVFFPEKALCTDNALMIAYAGAQRLTQADLALSLHIKPRWPLTELPSFSD